MDFYIDNRKCLKKYGALFFNVGTFNLPKYIMEFCLKEYVFQIVVITNYSLCI
jgi:hypothetical protein